MKCSVVFDKEGKILSMGYSERPELEADDGLIARGGPVVEADQTIVELYVPDKYAKMPLREFIERVQADVKAKRPVRKPGKE